MTVLRILRVPVESRLPSAQQQRQQNAEGLDETVTSFGQALENETSLRAKCKTVSAFKKTYKLWQERELGEGRPRRGSPSTVLYKLKSMSDAKCKQLGVAKLNVVGQAVYVGNSRSGSLASAEQRVRDSRETAEKDKHSIIVTPVLPVPVFGEVAAPGLTLCATLHVRNGSDHEPCELSSVRLLNPSGSGFSVTSLKGATVLEPLAYLTLQSQFCSQNVGVSRDVLMLQFRSLGLQSRSFTISRYLEVRCGDAVELEELAPKTPYQKRRRSKRPPPRAEVEVVDPPPKPKPVEPRQAFARLKQYYIEDDFRRLLDADEATNRLEQGAEGMTLAARAAISHYKQHMTFLLWAEEHQLVRDLEQVTQQRLVCRLNPTS